MIPTRVRKPMPVSGLRTAWPSDQLGDAHTPRAVNVRIRFGRVRPTMGRRLAGGNAINEPVLHIDTFSKVNGTKWIIKLTNTGLYRWGNSTPGAPADWYRVTGPVISGTGRWGVASGEDFLFFSRRDEPGIYRWNGVFSAPYQLIPASAGIVPAASFLAYYNDRLIAGNIREDPGGSPVVWSNRLRWPISTDHTNWGGTGSGFLDLYEGVEEPIGGMAVLGGRLTVFRQHTITDVVKTGTITPVHRSEVRVAGIGCQAPYTVLATLTKIFFLARDMNVWSWDGATAQVESDAIQDTLQAVLDPSKLGDYFGVTLPNQHEYWLVMNTGDVFVYDYLRNIWLRDSYPSITAAAEVDKQTTVVTWDVVTTTWDTEARNWAEMEGLSLATIFAGRSTGETFEITDQISSDYFSVGSIIDRYIETGDFYIPTPRSPGEGDQMSENGRIKRGIVIYEFTDASPFEIWISNDRGQTWPTKKTIVPETRGYSFVDFDQTAHVFRFRFKEEDANAQFRWGSYGFEFLPGDI